MPDGSTRGDNRVVASSNKFLNDLLATTNVPPGSSDAAAQLGVADVLRDLGLRLREARVARDITIAALARRMKVNARTVQRMESGAPGVSIETVALALWSMGMLSHLVEVAALKNDGEGQRLSAQRAPRRARGSKIKSPGWELLDRLDKD